MIIYNNGSFLTRSKEDTEKLIDILNTETDFFDHSLTEKDVKHNSIVNIWSVELPNDLTGEIGYLLSNVANKCVENGIDAEFSISCWGDYEASYSFKDGAYEELDDQDTFLRNMSDSALLDEIARRGLTIPDKTPHSDLYQVICDDAGCTFAECTSFELAKAAVKKLISEDIGYDKDDLEIVKSNLKLNQLILDGEKIDLDENN